MDSSRIILGKLTIHITLLGSLFDALHCLKVSKNCFFPFNSCCRFGCCTSLLFGHPRTEILREECPARTNNDA